MNKYVFQKSIEISTDLGTIFNFHSDTNNLPRINPPGIKAEIVYMSDSPLKRGSRVVIRLSKLIFSIHWSILIKEYSFPELVADLQEKGFFKYWLHYHIFEEAENGVKMTDKIEFIPPFGIIGKLLLPFIYRNLEAMFSYRHQKTKELLER